MRARGGGIGFVYPSSQNQLIAETHIVLVLYGLMTGGVIMLAKDRVQTCVFHRG